MFCITNNPDVSSRPCTVTNAHTANCDSDTCLGCQPREATFGMLCAGCTRRLTDIMVQWQLFESELDGVDRAVTPDTTGNTSKPGSKLPLADTWLSIEECKSYLKSYRGNLEQWVSTPDGATESLMFMRVAKRAFVKHPIAELPHRIHSFRCSECGWMRLTWNPPQFAGDKVRLICSNPDCGHEIGQSAFEMVAKAAEANREQ